MSSWLGSCTWKWSGNHKSLKIITKHNQGTFKPPLSLKFPTGWTLREFGTQIPINFSRVYNTFKKCFATFLLWKQLEQIVGRTSVSLVTLTCGSWSEGQHDLYFTVQWFCPIDLYWTKVITQLANGSISVWICGLGQPFWDILFNFAHLWWTVSNVSTARLSELQSDRSKRLFEPQALAKRLKI